MFFVQYYKIIISKIEILAHYHTYTVLQKKTELQLARRYVLPSWTETLKKTRLIKLSREHPRSHVLKKIYCTVENLMVMIVVQMTAV